MPACHLWARMERENTMLNDMLVPAWCCGLSAGIQDLRRGQVGACWLVSVSPAAAFGITQLDHPSIWSTGAARRATIGENAEFLTVEPRPRLLTFFHPTRASHCLVTTTSGSSTQNAALWRVKERAAQAGPATPDPELEEEKPNADISRHSGDGACGKTSLLNVFTRGYFPTVYEPTVFENYVHDIFIDNVHIELSLWDTAGQEEFDRLRSLSYDNTDVVVLCFSVDSKDSLENVESKWVGEIQENCPGVKLVLVALKCDLRENTEEDEDAAASGTEGVQREKKPMITYDQGLEVARRIKALRYLECSAMRNRGVNEAFTEAARVALSVKPTGENESKCSVM
ncbi:putative Rho3 protein [Seiridium unicorne]|uniref:Rho3 protein n=1 Tax=Seiridium unicorne TaxID=138068 RepID=A0ABR2UXW5_9PEZI